MKNVEIPILRIVGLMIGIYLLTGSSLAQSTQDSTNVIAFTENMTDSQVRQHANPPITLELDQVSLKEALKRIAGQAQAGLYYNAALLPEKTVSLHLKAVPLGRALRKVLEGTSLKVVTSGRNITLREKRETLPMQLPLAPIQETITGTVTDASSGETLPGVNILVKGTSTGTSTDSQGNFELTVESLQDTLVVSYIGYQTKEVPIAGRTTIDITLQPQTISGEELVVVGYGTQQRSDLTGSISSISEEDFSEGISTSADQLIGNTVSGVRFVQGSSLPGSDAEINIRGSSSINADTGPLYVIDGLPITTTSATTGSSNSGFTDSRFGQNPLNSINPADIKSIEILKDASATAIYGNRGANGVILITTKSGREGNIQVNYNGYAGVQTVGNRLDLLGPQEYKSVINGIIDDGGGQPEFRVDEIANDGVGTDWQGQIFRDAAPVTSHNLSFSGGSDNLQYFASLNYFGQDGIVKTSSLKRYTARLNIDFQASDKFNAGLNISTSYTKNQFVANGFAINELGGVIQAAYNYPPVAPVRTSNGEYFYSDAAFMDNPLAILEAEDSFANTYRTFGTIFGEYELLPSFSVKLNVGGDFTSQRRDTYVGPPTILGTAANGIASLNFGWKSNYLIEGTINYIQDVGIHSIDAVAGATFQRFVTDRANISAQDFPSSATKTYNVGLGNPAFYNVGSTRFTNELMSFLGRINYQFDNKYLVTTTIRVDGSSRFGDGNRYGVFPSAALGWRLDQEAFMETVDFISTLKPRVSWGITGNQDIGNLQFVTTFGSGPVGIIDGQEVSTIEPNRLGNPNLRWETTRQWDIGIDFGMFNERITGIIDFFNKYTEDMLIALPVPTSTGYNTQLSNVGSIRNTGFELGLNTKNVSQSNIQWNTDISFSTLNNEVENIGNIQSIITGNAGRVQQIGIIREGAPLFSFYGWEVEGVWQQGDDFSVTNDPVAPGDLKYKDLNSDGTITGEDRKVLGNSFPDFTWSVGNTISYYNFNLNFMFVGIEGIKMLNVNQADNYYPTALRRNKIAEPYLNRWTPENPSDKYPSFVNPNKLGKRSVNSRTVEDASYIRLKTVRLSYNIPTKVLGNTMRSATIYVTGENLWTITDYTGPDPAVNPNGNANFRVDWNSAPMVTSFLLGVKLGI